MLGCALFLAIGIEVPTPGSLALPAQLAWLALVGSAPTLLVLVAAQRTGGARRRMVVLVLVTVCLVVGTVAWPHTDHLLSGPAWARHPDRSLLRLGMSTVVGGLAAAGFGWLVLGSRTLRGCARWGWSIVTLGIIAGLTVSMFRYRAYDHTLARAVFIGGVLSAALVHQALRSPAARRIAWVAALGCALFGAGSRLVAELPETGHREVIAHSRAGALVTLHVLPRFERDAPGSGGPASCDVDREEVEAAGLGIDPRRRRNVLIITVDALRNDVVGASVDATRVTPSLDAWAARALSFERATTTYPATLFAMGSAFTGLSPAELYLSPAMPKTIFTRTRGQVDRQLVVLPDVSWFRLPIVVDFLTPGAEVDLATSDAVATRRMIARLRSARAEGESVVGWIHYYSPHDPYVRHPSSPFGQGKRNAYLGEVAYFDRQLGDLLRYLEEDGWMEDTLVVFFSDHGEALGEQRYFGHHVYLNAWMIDVPLMLWHADVAPTRSLAGASVADVAPTVLHFLGLPGPKNVGSQSLFTLDPVDRSRATYSEAFPVRGRALFDSFRLPSLDEATIRDRIAGIRVASRGYEPKGAISRDRSRLIHHRSADAAFLYRTNEHGIERRVTRTDGEEEASVLQAALEKWEMDQLDRVRCRLRLSEDATGSRGPE